MFEATEKALAKFKAALDAARNSKKTPEQIEKAKELYDSLDPGDRTLLEYIFPEVVEIEDERLEKVRETLIKALKREIDAHCDGYKYFGITLKDIVACLEKQKEQNGSLRVIKDASEWEKIKEQKPAEWSEEDEKNLQIIEWSIHRCNGIWHCTGEECPIAKCQSWLKSLRPQSHWKPSEEQMETLQIAYKEMRNTKMRSTLLSLYNDLKKLM